MTIKERLRVVQEEMAALAREGEEPDFFNAIGALKDAATATGRSWSGSWLGYQANVYYRNLAPIPQGTHFSSEWGLRQTYSPGTVGTWQEFTSESIQQSIQGRAGSPDMEMIRRKVDAAATRGLEARTTLLALLGAVRRTVGSEPNLAAVQKDIEDIRMVHDDEILNLWRPKAPSITRDARAANQGMQAPGHLRTLASMQ